MYANDGIFNTYFSLIIYLEKGVEWRIYYICRDYLEGITLLANAHGTLAQELSYDAWGRLRNPQTQEVYGEWCCKWFCSWFRQYNG